VISMSMGWPSSSSRGFRIARRAGADTENLLAKLHEAPPVFEDVRCEAKSGDRAVDAGVIVLDARVAEVMRRMEPAASELKGVGTVSRRMARRQAAQAVRGVAMICAVRVVGELRAEEKDDDAASVGELVMGRLGLDPTDTRIRI
jgi:hypothetical protein